MPTLRIDQSSGAGAGTAGQARDNLWRGRAVTLVDAGSEQGAAVFALEDKPSESTSSLSGATLTPDVTGSYRVSLTKAGVKTELAFRVTRDEDGVEVGQAWPLPTFKEKGGHSVGTSTRGHAPLIERMATDVRTAVGAGWRRLAPGANKGTELTTLLAAGWRWFKLEAGEYDLDQRVAFPAGAEVHIEGKGSRRTIWVPSFADSTSLADDDASFCFGAPATRSGTTTTLVAPGASLTHWSGTEQLSLANAGPLGLVAGDVVELSGTNVGDDMYGHSPTPDITIYELCVVASVAGNVVTLRAPTQKHHGVGTTVRKLTPGAMLRMSGMDLGNDGGQVAVGVLLDACIRPELLDVGGAGFSRGIVVGKAGVHDGDFELVDRGERNAIIFMRSMTGGRIRSVSRMDAKTSHPQGIIRGGIVLRNRTTNVLLKDLEVHRVATGVSLWGTVGTRIRGDCRISHCRVDERLTRMGGEANVSGRIPSAFDAGCSGVGGSPNFGEYNHALDIESLYIEECRHSGGGDAFASSEVIFCDVKGGRVGAITVVNKGRSGDLAGSYMHAVQGFDCFDLQIGELRAVGCLGLNLYNWCGITVDSLVHDYAAGEGTVASGLYIQLTNGGDGYPTRITRAVLGGTAPIVSKPGTQCRDLSIGELTINGLHMDDCIALKNTTGLVLVLGNVVEIYDADPSTGVRAVRIPTHTGVDDKVVIVQNLDNNTWGLFAIGSRRAPIVPDGTAVAVGDKVVPIIGQRVAGVDNNATAWLGRSLQKKGAAGAAIIQMVKGAP